MPYHPMGNGMAERYIQTPLNMTGTLKKIQKSDWKTFVPSLTHAYNATMHEGTGHSPFYLMIGRHLRLAIDAFLWIGLSEEHKVSKGAKIRSRYNQVPHPTQDTNGKVTNSQLDTTNESQEVSPFPAGDREAHINRRAQRHSTHKTEQKHKRSTKEVPPWNGQ